MIPTISTNFNTDKNSTYSGKEYGDMLYHKTMPTSEQQGFNKDNEKNRRNSLFGKMLQDMLEQDKNTQTNNAQQDKDIDDFNFLCRTEQYKDIIKKYNK